MGVNVETLRYYERRGIIAEPDRSLGGHRMYSEETVTTLRVIKAAQHLGFTLDEVAELLEAVRQRHWQLTAGQDRGEARRGGAQDRRPRGHPGQLGRGA